MKVSRATLRMDIAVYVGPVLQRRLSSPYVGSMSFRFTRHVGRSAHSDNVGELCRAVLFPYRVALAAGARPPSF